MLVLLLALTACAPALRTEAAPLARMEVLAMEELYGTWVYAEDPGGRIRKDPLYEGSTLTFAPGGAISFRFGGANSALTGTCLLEGGTADTLRLVADYGEGRNNRLSIQAHRSADGTVSAFTIVEEEWIEGARYYVRVR